MSAADTTERLRDRDGNRVVRINYEDAFRFNLTLEVDPLMPRHYPVNEEEHQELVRLQAEYQKLQIMLERIANHRVELEYDFDAHVFKPTES